MTYLYRVVNKNIIRNGILVRGVITPVQQYQEIVSIDVNEDVQEIYCADPFKDARKIIQKYARSPAD